MSVNLILALALCGNKYHFLNLCNTEDRGYHQGKRVKGLQKIEERFHKQPPKFPGDGSHHRGLSSTCHHARTSIDGQSLHG